MDGVYDLGGLEGFGPVTPEDEDEPLFHAEWEQRAFVLTLASGLLGKWNIDESRHARENQHPAAYLNNSYYENWLTGLERLLVDKGLVTQEELKTGKAAGKAPADVHAPDAEETRRILMNGTPVSMDEGPAPMFRPGDRVRVRNLHPHGHTRAPRFTRGRVGTVVLYHGIHVFADRNAHGEHVGEPIYNVVFDGNELWGADAEPGLGVHVDLWQPHLEAAE